MRGQNNQVNDDPFDLEKQKIGGDRGREKENSQE